MFKYDLPQEGDEPVVATAKRQDGLLQLSLKQYCIARQFRDDHVGGFEEFCRGNYSKMNSHEWDAVFAEYQNTPVK